MRCNIWEDFHENGVSSMNHHFWGDISAWFIKRIAGICLNPDKHNVNELKIAPAFISALDNASAYHMAPSGKILSSWVREGENVILTLEIPAGINASAELEAGYTFEDLKNTKSVTSGTYKIIPRI